MAWVTPPVFTVGEILTSGDMNKISGNLSYLVGITWTAFSLLNSWTNAVGSVAAYAKDGLGWVHCRGTIQNGTSSSEPFVFPTGYRPSDIQQVLPIQCSGNANGQIVINTDGSTALYWNGSSISSIDGVSFYSG